MYLAFEASGKHLYTGTYRGITGFTVDPATGALSSGSTFPFPSGKGVEALTSTFTVK